MDTLAENRNNAQFAASVMEKICPSPVDRRLVLQQLLDSIAITEHISPDVWELTLFNNRFRLNVGPVEVMTYRQIALLRGDPGLFEVRLLFHGNAPDKLQQLVGEDEQTHAIYPTSYRSIPVPQSVYTGTGEFIDGALSSACHQKIRTALNLVTPLHADFIHLAAHTKNGKLRKTTSFRRSHSLGLYAYAQAFVREESADGHATGSRASSATQPRTVQNELPSTTPLVEGTAVTIQVDAYERNPAARQRCIAHYGCRCAVCDFDFGAIYGNAANGCIHVHHLKPLASIGTAHDVNPIRDLRPVCPNCHAVIHLRQPPYSIDEVKTMLAQRGRQV